MKRAIQKRIWLLLCGLCLAAQSANACSACFGKSDSSLAVGMNMGILSLLAVIVSVLIGISAFFFYIIRRSAAVNTDVAPTNLASQPAQNNN